MLREEMSKAAAALVAKCSTEAQAKKRELQSRMRAIAIESLDLVSSELQRLRVEEGKDFADASATIGLVRKQMETVDFNGPMDLAVMEQVLIAGNAYDAIRQCSSQVQARRKELEAPLRSLVLEDFDILLGELRRLSLECTGRQAMDYAEASALLGLMRQQMETQDLEDSKMPGAVGVVLDAIRSAAKDDIKKQSRGN